MFICNGIATCNCLVEVFSKLLFKISIRNLKAVIVGTFWQNLHKKLCHQPLLSCRNNACLSRYMYLLTNTNLLFSSLFPLYGLISSFSFRHKLHFLLLKLYGRHSLKMHQVIFGIKSQYVTVFFRQLCIICIIFMCKGFVVVVKAFFA